MPLRKAAQMQDLQQERMETLRAERRALIIETAKRVFTRDGLEKASMRTIAKEAGCTTGAIYPYFSGKEEIYGAVLSDSLTLLRDYIQQRIEAAETPRAKARTGLTAFHDYYRAQPDELALGLYLFQGLGPNGLNKDLDRSLNAQLAEIFTLLSEPCRAGGIGDPTAVAGAGIAQAIGALILEQTGRIKLVGKSSPDLMKAFLDSSFGPD